MKNRLVIRLLLLFVLLCATAFLVFNENGLLKYLKARRELNAMELQIRNAEMKLSLLEMEIDSLQTSKEKIERVAREKFHMMKKSEKAFRVEEK